MCKFKFCNWLKNMFSSKCNCEKTSCCDDGECCDNKKEDIITPQEEISPEK